MDSFYPKTRRPIANLSTPLKRPPPSVTPPKANKILATPTTPKDARIVRPKAPPPVRHKGHHDIQKKIRRPISVRELFDTVHLHDKSEPKDQESTIDLPTPLQLASPLKLPPALELASPKKLPVRTDLSPARSASHDILASPVNSKTIPETPDSPSKIASGPLKGVSTSLLDLIRAKEAKAKCITPEQERRRELLGIAPEVSRIISTVFTAYKKDILPYDKVVEKCFKGLKSNYTTPTIIECLDLLDKIAPEWVSIVDISRGRFMRVNRDKYTKPQLLEAIKNFKKEHGIH